MFADRDLIAAQPPDLPVMVPPAPPRDANASDGRSALSTWVSGLAGEVWSVLSRWVDWSWAQLGQLEQQQSASIPGAYPLVPVTQHTEPGSSPDVEANEGDIAGS